MHHIVDYAFCSLRFSSFTNYVFFNVLITRTSRTSNDVYIFPNYHDFVQSFEVLNDVREGLFVFTTIIIIIIVAIF